MRKSKFLQSSKDMLHRSFKPDKCKTSLRLVTSRLKLMRNKKEVQVKQLRREVAQLLESGQDPTARIKVEHVVREEKMMAAYELISLYSELVITRLPIIESQKNCPIDLKEAVTSLIFASPRCGDIPELVDVQKHFTAKYGKDFVAAAVELRPDCGVSRMLVEKLSVKAPDGQTKLKILTAIAEEHSIKWDPKPFGDELAAPTDLLNGPASFQAAAQHIQPPLHEPLQTPQAFQAPVVQPQSTQHEPSQVSQNQTQYQPLKPEQNDRISQETKNVNSSYSEGRPMSSYSQNEAKSSATERPTTARLVSDDRNTSSSHGQNWNMDFKDAASAAQSAAESAERATMAARAAAEFASRDSMKKPHYTEPHQSGPHSRRDSSEFEGENKKYASSSYDSDRHRRSDSDQLQGVNFKNPGGTPVISNQAGSDRTEKSNRQHSLRSNDSQYDGSYDHSSRDAGEHTQKSMYKEEAAEPNTTANPEYRRDVRESSNYDEDFHHIEAVNSPKNMYYEHAAEHNKTEKPHFDEPEYSNDLHEISSFNMFHEIQAVNSVKENDTSFNLQSSIYDESNDPFDNHHQSFKSHSGADSHFGIEKGKVHTDISRAGSGNSTFAVFDEATSEHEHKLFDTGPKYDDQDSDSDYMPSGKEAPSNIFRVPSDLEFGLEDSKSTDKSVFQQSRSPGKHSSHEFSVISEASVDDFKFDDQLSAKFDGSEDSSNESSHTSRIYLEASPGSKGQIFPSPRSSFKEQGNQGVMGKSHLKSSPDESDEEIPTQSRSEFSSKLNFGNLTGGLRHKRYALPSYKSTQVDDASSPLKTTAEESSSKISTASITTHSRVNTEVKQNKNNRENIRLSHDDSDTDSSDDERSAQGSVFGRESYTQPQVEDTDTNSRSKFSDPYFESGSDEVPQHSKQTSFGRNNVLSGLSRRTKATPASPARTSKVEPNLVEPKSSAFSSGRKSAFSSYGSRSNDEPESRWTKDTPSGPRTPKFQPKRQESDDSDFSSDGSPTEEEPESVRTTATYSHGSPKAQPKLKGTVNSEFGSGRKSTLSSYGSDFPEETESPSRSLGPSRNSDRSSPTRKSSEQMPEGSGRKSTLSSFGSHFTEETESPKRSSGPSRNSEKSRPTGKSSEQIQEGSGRKPTLTYYGSHFTEETESPKRSSGPSRNPEVSRPTRKSSEEALEGSGRKSTLSSYGSHFTEETESPKRSSGPSRNPEVSRPTRKSSEEALEGSGRKSTLSSYGSHFTEETESPKKSSGPSRNPEISRPTRKSSEQIPQTGKKSTVSSYGSHFTEETESPKKSLGPSRNPEISRPTRKSSEQIPESKVSSRQESLESTAAEQSDISQQKEDSTTKISQASQVTGKAPTRSDSSKKPSHVHPKLPDYDTFAAFFKKQ